MQISLEGGVFGLNFSGTWGGLMGGLMGGLCQTLNSVATHKWGNNVTCVTTNKRRTVNENVPRRHYN